MSREVNIWVGSGEAKLISFAYISDTVNVAPRLSILSS